MDWIEQPFWLGIQPFFEALGMAEPRLRFLIGSADG
jgi:hypothetical protein